MSEDWLREKAVKVHAFMILEGIRSLTLVLPGPKVENRSGKEVETKYTLSMGRETMKLAHSGNEYGLETRTIYEGPVSWLKGVIDYDEA